MINLLYVSRKQQNGLGLAMSPAVLRFSDSVKRAPKRFKKIFRVLICIKSAEVFVTSKPFMIAFQKIEMFFINASFLHF